MAHLLIPEFITNPRNEFDINGWIEADRKARRIPFLRLKYNFLETELTGDELLELDEFMQQYDY